MTKIFEKTELVDLVPNEIAEKLNNSQKLIIGQLISMNGLEQNKNNDFVFLSNQDFCNLIGITEPTLIKNIIKLEVMGLITRKAGKRSSKGSKASEYKLNLNTQKFTKDFTKDFSDNFSNNFSINLSNDFSKEIIGIITEYQHFMNKAMDLLLKVNTKDFSDNFSNNFSTDTETDIELDKDIEKDNNIINKNNNLNIIEEKENIFINKNIKEKETLLNENLESSNKNYIFAKEPLTEETTKKETIETSTDNNKINETSKENNMIETSTPSNLTAEKAIIEHFNAENAVKHTPSEHYNIILPSEQKRIFNELIEKMKTSTSMEELADKHYKMQKYMKEHTFMIFYIDEERRIYKELKEKLNTSTENENKVPSSPSNVLDGIVISPMDLNPTDAKNTASDQVETDIEQAESPNEPFLSPTSPSNDLGGVVDRTDGENSADAKEMPLNQKNYNPLEIVEKIKAERMEGLRKAIDDATTIQELRDAAKKVNSLRNSLSTDEMAELAEIMDSKVKYL